MLIVTIPVTTKVEPDGLVCGQCRFQSPDERCSLYDEFYCGHLSERTESEQAVEEVE